MKALLNNIISVLETSNFYSNCVIFKISIVLINVITLFSHTPYQIFNVYFLFKRTKKWL